MVNKDALPVLGTGSDYKKHTGTRVPDKKLSLLTSSAASPCGTKNLEPQEMMADAKKTPTLYAVLRIKSRLLFGKGVILGAVNGHDSAGNEIVKPIKDAKIDDFLKRSNFNQQIIRAVNSYPFYENIFPELILTRDRKQVFMVNYLKPPYCRWERKSEKDHMIKKLFVSAAWQGQSMPSDYASIPCMDEYFPLESLRESGLFKMAFRYIDVSEDDKEYYQTPIWNPVRTSQWLSVAQRIPEFKDYLFDNQMAVKYHIEYAREYFEWKYKGFQDMSTEERIKILSKERTNMENTLSGVTAAGKSITSVGHIDRQSGNYIPGVQINELKSKFGSGDYVEDMQEATAQMMVAMGVPPTLLGISPGKKFGAGSGSDIREAYNMYIAMQEMDRQRILEPWQKSFEYNGYSDEIRLLWQYPVITTIDKNTETQIEK
jgi:hypothetical protein